jgi:hypothetical protein
VRSGTAFSIYGDVAILNIHFSILKYFGSSQAAIAIETQPLAQPQEHSRQSRPLPGQEEHGVALHGATRLPPITG